MNDCVLPFVTTMRRALPLCLAAALALAAETAWGQGSQTARKTTADALKQMLDRGDKVLVIDVRSDEEVKSGSIPGALHIPMEELEARMKDVPRDVQLVFT